MLLEGSQRELVEACQRGERDAFRTLFETYKNKVYSIALRFAGDEASAMDIAQDTFLKLFSSIHDFRGDSAFETWVYRMVVNSCLDRQRKLSRFVPLADEFLATLRASGDALAAMLRAEMAGRIRAAVGQAIARTPHRRGAAIHRRLGLRPDCRSPGLLAGHRGVASQSRA